jgi:glutamyl-Q tRNA(Asp) synthetase
VAAVGSYLQARRNNGSWLVRIEDLDPPREQSGAADAILRTLDRYGFEWDEEVVYQSKRHPYYEEILHYLFRENRAYPCVCSRKDIANATGGGHIYPETCRNRAVSLKRGRSLRLKTAYETVRFDDAIQGRYTQNVRAEVGDFVLRRADGFYAYQLAVVADDAEQHITEVVRGADLLDNTPRQIYLQRLLDYPSMNYAHLPVVTKDGDKLSKQTKAQPVDRQPAEFMIIKALEFLGHAPPRELRDENLAAIWEWAHKNWRIQHVPATTAMDFQLSPQR